MPSINMIAARRAEKHRLEQKTRNLIYSILAEGGLFMVALSFMVLQFVSVQGQSGDLKDKIAKLKTQVDQIQQLQEQTARLQPKLTALDDARDSTMYWYTSIQNITNSLSNTSWLANLNTSGDPAGPPPAPTGSSAIATVAPPAQLLIAGMSLTQADVGLTMLRMNQYPQFDRVTLNFVQEQQQQTTAPGASEKSAVNPVQFQIAVQLHSTAPVKPAKKSMENDNVQKS